MGVSDPTQRFSSRVADYIRYRPGYPAEILPLLQGECGLTSEWLVADVGSGTGLLTELFLRHGNPVYGIEPNADMRAAGEQHLAGYPRFHSLPGTAEDTGLPDGSADLIVAGQAFHWFDLQRARQEFARILRPAGWVALIWNERRVSDTRFLEGYEALLLRHAPEYALVDHRRIDQQAITHFFQHDRWKLAVLSNKQVFDLEGLEGRARSSSYTPPPGTPEGEAMLRDLRLLFSECQEHGRVVFPYDTLVYYGALSGRK